MTRSAWSMERLPLLEERADVVDDRAVRLDQGDQLPLVEGRARMGQAHADPVADLQVRLRRRPQPRVLVGEAGDLDTGGGAFEAVPAHHLGEGEVEVVRRV